MQFMPVEATDASVQVAVEVLVFILLVFLNNYLRPFPGYLILKIYENIWKNSFQVVECAIYASGSHSTTGDYFQVNIWFDFICWKIVVKIYEKIFEKIVFRSSSVQVAVDVLAFIILVFLNNYLRPFPG